MSGNASAPPDRIRDQAADWVVRLHEAAPEELDGLRRACDTWQESDPRHRRVFEQMRALWDGLEPRRKRRRRLAGPALCLALLLALGAWRLPWAYWQGTTRTATGEVRTLTLADGSTVTLDSHSSIRVLYDPHRRRIELKAGRILLVVRHDPSRPFQVSTPQGSAVALGTRYSVALRDDTSDVAVQQSSVRVIPAEAPAAAVTLQAGQRASFDSHRVAPGAANGKGTFSWAEHRLTFNDAPLDRVINRLSRYRPGLLLATPALKNSGLRFTGVLPTDDPDAALRLLVASLPVDARRISPWLVWLSVRG